MIKVIPAIDIIEGKCVRLVQGDYEQKKVYNEDPLEVARWFEDAGLQRLHLVDLDGAKEGTVKNWKVLERLAARTSLVIDFSGGISSEKNVQICFDSGAAFAALGSMAAKEPLVVNEWLMRFGAYRFIIGADVKEEKIVVKGWTETTELTVFELIRKFEQKGITHFFCTDVSKDGLLEGSSIDLYKKIIQEFPAIALIASGGVTTLEEIEQLSEIGCKGAIIGKAIYENKIALKDLKRWLI